jgi:ATP-binding cassette subfamily B (MDR/TAP) protein 1
MAQRRSLVATENGVRPSQLDNDLDHNTALEDTTFNPAQPREWHTPMAAVTGKLWRQILGLNPFKGSYFGLFATLRRPLDQALAYSGVLFAIAAGVPLPVIVSLHTGQYVLCH